MSPEVPTEDVFWETQKARLAQDEYETALHRLVGANTEAKAAELALAVYQSLLLTGSNDGPNGGEYLAALAAFDRDGDGIEVGFTVSDGPDFVASMFPKLEYGSTQWQTWAPFEDWEVWYAAHESDPDRELVDAAAFQESKAKREAEAELEAAWLGHKVERLEGLAGPQLEREKYVLFLARLDFAEDWRAQRKASEDVVQRDEPLEKVVERAAMLEAYVEARQPGAEPFADAMAAENLGIGPLEHRELEVELRRREVRRLADEIEAGPSAGLVVRSRAEMSALPSPSFVWDGWLYSSSPALLAAPGGIGKTTLALGLAVATFHGLPLLGSFTRKGRTLYIAGEGERVLDRRVQAWEKHLGLTGGSTDIGFIYGSPLNEATLRDLKNLVAGGGYQLVIADTFSALTQIASENDNREVSGFLRAFHRSVLDADPESTPLLVHHVTETTDVRGFKKQKSRGASAFRDDHDTVIMLGGNADSFSASTEASKAGKQKDAAPQTLDGLALRKVGPHVVVVLQEAAERSKHRAEVERLVSLMVPGSGYSSTELQERWGMASNKNRYQTIRTEALSSGLIAKGAGNKGRYTRLFGSVRSALPTKARPNMETEPNGAESEFPETRSTTEGDSRHE